jgi:hypothetical protein
LKQNCQVARSGKKDEKGSWRSWVLEQCLMSLAAQERF